AADAPVEEVQRQLKGIQGLLEKTEVLGVKRGDAAPLRVAGAEFILEGLYALKKISRNEEMGYYAERRPPEPPPDEPSPISPRLPPRGLPPQRAWSPRASPSTAGVRKLPSPPDQGYGPPTIPPGPCPRSRISSPARRWQWRCRD